MFSSSVDSSAVSWLSSGLGLEDSIFGDQFDFTDEMDHEFAAVLGQNFEIPCLSPLNESSFPMNFVAAVDPPPPSDPEPPAKLRKPNGHSPGKKNDRVSSTPIILNFGPEKKQRHRNSDVSEKLNSNTADPKGETSLPVRKSGRIRPPSQTYDHIIAERKRREQLSQRFLALSTIVPGLKKTDKTSVLGDAIKYVKFLQERVNLLEEEAKNKSIESVVLIKKSTTDENCDTFRSTTEDPLPEIEARSCNSQILIRIHCEYQKGMLANIIYNVEKLNLNVVNTFVASFSRLVFDITIVTEMEKEFNMTVKEVVTRIRTSLLSPNTDFTS